MIWIILLGGMVQGAFAQNLEIKGMVRDARNKEILEFAKIPHHHLRIFLPKKYSWTSLPRKYTPS